MRIAPDGSVTVMTGRVELGQGMLTAMRQVAGEELDVAPERLVLISGDTGQTPNEGQTAGSLAIKLGSTALGLACADARAALIGVAAKAWDVEPQAIKVEDGMMLGPAGQRMGYGEAAANVSLSRPVDVTAKRKAPDEQRIIGTSYPRIDIPAKVFAQTESSSMICDRRACCSAPWRGRRPMQRASPRRTSPPSRPCPASWRWYATALSWAW